MQRQNARVMVASEYPEARHLVSEVASRESGAVIVGHAENGLNATTLARSVRPDVVLLDCHLPYTVGLDAVPLSRVGGLDAALTITRELPATQVIVLGNLDAAVLGEQVSIPALEVCLSRTMPLTAQDVSREAFPPGAIVFANLVANVQAAQISALLFSNPQAQRRKGLSQGIDSISDQGLWLGGLAIIAGMLLIGTMIFALPGVFIALAGVGVMLLGMSGKATAALGSRASLLKRIKGSEEVMSARDGDSLAPDRPENLN